MKVRTLAVVAVAPVALTLLAAGPALAASPAPQTVQAAKTLVDSRIDGRLHTLDALKTAIAGATNLTSAHRSTLSALISTDTTALTALRGKVDGETTLQAIRDDEHSMVVDYRIYMLVEPKVRFAIASDDETVSIGKLQDVKGKLATAIADAQRKGKDVSAEQLELTDLTNQVGAAQSALAGKVDTLLTVAPSSDAAAMTAAVNPVRAAVRAARTDIGKAVGDAKQIRKQLS
jgi:hypothetical protein